MTSAERVLAAVAWCASHNATVRFRYGEVQVTVGRRVERALSLVQAVAAHAPELTL